MLYLQKVTKLNMTLLLPLDAGNWIKVISTWRLVSVSVLKKSLRISNRTSSDRAGRIWLFQGKNL